MVVFSSWICPSRLRMAIIIGTDPSTSITENSVSVTVEISFRSGMENVRCL